MKIKNGFPVQIISTGEERVVERLGKYNRTIGAGLNFIIPLIESTRKCNVKQCIIDTPPQNMITLDNVSVNINALVFYRVEDSFKALYKIDNFISAIAFSAMTNLRSLVGAMKLEDLLSQRETINKDLLSVVDSITDDYGVKIISVEIQDITLSKEIEEAMNLEKSASLKKRAMILESEGEKYAAIEKSTGKKQSMILEAEGNKEKLLLEGQAQAEYKEKIAKADALVIKEILSVLNEDVDNYLQLKQLEGIVEMSKGASHKLLIPSDTLNTLGSINTLVDIAKSTKEEIKE